MTAIPNLVTVDLDESRTGAAGAESVADGLLDALDRSGTRATFFIPRAFAESRAAATRRVSERGHEVACLTTAQPARSKPYCAAFCTELETARDAIEGATGVRVRGHRNASFAVDYASEWTYDVLVDRGFEYDSSRIPPKYVEFGNQPVPRTAHAVRRWSGTLLEVPVSTTDVLTMRVRLGGVSTIRGLPMPVWSVLVANAQARREPLVFHVRASELHRGKAVERVGQVVGKFPFTSVANALPDLLRGAPILET